jgi:cobaltochelatase CobN
LPPSVLPDISPTRGEIKLAAIAVASSSTLGINEAVDDGSISPLVGEMSALRQKLRRTEGGNVGYQFQSVFGAAISQAERERL